MSPNDPSPPLDPSADRTLRNNARPASANDRLAALFPDLADGPRSVHWWQRKGRVALVGVTAAALLGVGAIAASASASDAPTYRTAAASIQNVDTLLSGVATIEPVSQAAVTFPVAGTVSTVDVAVGDTVTIGQTLATLDTNALTDTLHDTQATLAQAELVLSKALAGEDVSGLSGGSGGTNSGSSGGVQPASTTTDSDSLVVDDAVYTTDSSGGTSGTTVELVATTASAQDPTATAGDPAAPTTDSGLAAAQQAVLDAQKAVDAAMTAATDALSAANNVCASIGVDAADATDDESATTSTVAASISGSLSACQTAINEVLAAQTAVSAAQADLSVAASALDTLLARMAADTSSATTAPSESTGNGGTGSAPSGTGSTGSTGTGSGATTTTTNTASSEDLIAYQKAVDAALLEVFVAQQAIEQATIVSPIAGDVVAVNMEPGDEATAGSTTMNVIIEGDGGFEVTTTVSVDEIPDVQVGQAATVVPDGTTTALSGEVVAISVAPDASATSTSYRVTIGLTGDTSTLRNGATGTVSIVTESATEALAVPSSAITTNGDNHTVTVVDGATAKTVEVQVGVVGDTWTEITDGVSKGQKVSLANLDEALPGSATDTSSSAATTADGGFTGSGFPGGGAGGRPTFAGGGPPGS